MSRKAQGNFILVVLALIILIIISLISLVGSVLSYIASTIISFPATALVVFTLLVCLGLFFPFYEYFYFRSKTFIALKNSISNFIFNCNELNHHIEDLKGSYVNIKSYDYGSSSMKDESNFNFKRVKWSNDIKNNFIHNCSAAVCKNANDQPIKYLCKYFNINISEDSLANIESVLNDFAAAEQGKFLLQRERDSILDNIKSSIPWFINRFSKIKLIRELGFENVDLSNLYFPVYTFQYVSAGGNSLMKCDIQLNIENLDKLINYMRGLINFIKSVEGQRALMTSNLREKIKSRDNFTCQICSLSANDEKNLLLEIDHIIPLSKGGITSESNLQTLCWKCNRSKGSKIQHS